MEKDKIINMRDARTRHNINHKSSQAVKCKCGNIVILTKDNSGTNFIGTCSKCKINIAISTEQIKSYFKNKK
jgi:hypothetical protein